MSVHQKYHKSFEPTVQSDKRAQASVFV